MASLIRILVADDSSVTRRIVTESISAEQDLEIVGAAQDGNEAVAFFKAQNPDVVMLDVDMPNLNGIGALKAIRALNESVPIIMFSTLTVKGGEATLDALSAGATDYAAKPTGVGHLDKAIQYLRTEVIPKLRTWGKRYKDRHEKKIAAPTITRETTPSFQSAPIATPAPAAAAAACLPGPARSAPPAG
ncbi:response regulator [Accumulibacter sp.]|uniref:response regulator n=1 Tax=Accumulibacter sp. TaxID=2053492 RepID=UPI001AC6F049|nr:response regulator [Accumulibacter sp.]MBN8455608.1 response regulator [Accumulibacter sp.]